MAQRDTLRRYLDAGMTFTQLTRERAEAIVADLVNAGEIRRKEAQDRVEELLERSRKNAEDLVHVIRREVSEQLSRLGLDEVARRTGLPVTDSEGSTPTAAAPTPATPTGSGAPTAKKAAPKTATTKKAATKAPANKAAAKSPAKKTVKKTAGPSKSAGGTGAG